MDKDEIHPHVGWGEEGGVKEDLKVKEAGRDETNYRGESLLSSKMLSETGCV